MTPGPSSPPAERYAAFQREKPTRCSRTSRASTASSSTTSRSAACPRSRTGRGVLVAAPTGSGKTIVGEFAVHLALQTGRKCFYTTPIKALSNQKYHDLVARYGADNVGLLTGDNVDQRRGAGRRDDHRGAAQHALRRVADPAGPRLRGHGRGALPRRPDARRGVGGGDHPPARVGDARLAVGDGLQRRGVRRVAGHRPRRDHHDRRGAATGAAVPARDGRPPAARPLRLLRRRRQRGLREGGRRSTTSSPGSPATTGPAPADARPALAAQGQARVVEEPARGRQRSSGVDPQPGRRGRAARPRGLLPAIVFIFSRAGCDAAVTQCLRPTSGSPTAGGARRDLRVRRGRVPAPCPRRTCTCSATTSSSTASPAASPRTTPGCCRRSRGASRSCSSAGCVKVVFATETLALGINMPARTVVIEKLSKWNGETTPTSRRGSTPSSPAAPAPRASTSRATASCSGSRA